MNFWSKPSFITGLFIMASAALTSPAWTAVELGGQHAINIAAAVKDTAVSKDGEWIYVLTDNGIILVYSINGVLEGKLSAGSGFDKVEAGPASDLIVVSSLTNQTVKLLSLNFVREIETEGSPSVGPQSAPVKIIVFSDFQCAYCAQLSKTLSDVHQFYPENVRIVYKNFPLKKHSFAMKAAIAALSADVQGKFWEYQKHLYQNFDSLDEEILQDTAEKVGMDLQLFNRQRQNPDLLRRVQLDIADGLKAQIKGTPAVFLNGKLLQDRSFDGILIQVEKELDKLQK